MRDLLAFLVCGLLVVSRIPSTAGQTPAARPPVNAEQFDQLFNQVKNWGRWGADDQLGAINLVTEGKRRQALSLAKTGRTVSLARCSSPRWASTSSTTRISNSCPTWRRR